MDTLPETSRRVAASAPAISVVIPLFNGERFIEQALRGIARQTLAPHEVIVVDDESSDRGCDVVEALAHAIPLRLVHKLNAGQSSARNLGVKHAAGSHIALLDQDDVWYPDHLAALLKPFIDNPTQPIGWTYSNLDEINQAGNLVARNVLSRAPACHPKTDLLACIRQDMLILPSASLIARDAFEAIGGFDETLSGYEDDDLFVRLFQAGHHNVYVDKALSQWRIHPNSATCSNRRAHSLLAFAQKLVGTFPDDAFHDIHYARDLILPRFIPEAADNLRRALRVGDDSLAETCREHLAQLNDMAGASRAASLQEPLEEAPATTNARITSIPKLADALTIRSNDTGFPGELIVPRFIDNAVRNLSNTLRPGDLPLADVSRQKIALLESLGQSPSARTTHPANLLVTAVIPLHNGEATIEEALTSVLTQTRPADEIIVVDDGSTDSGAAIVERLAETYPIRLLRQPNAGPPAARNLAVRRANGDLIALLDQDDSWYPSHLAELTEPFAHPRAKPLGWTYSNLDEVDRNGALVACGMLNRSAAEHPKSSLAEALRQDMSVLPSATILSRAAFEAVGGFDETLREDDDLFIRLLQAGYDNVYLPASLSRCRVPPRDASFSSRIADSRMDFARKLFGAFPDAGDRFYVRDLLIPRFRHHAVENLRRALHESRLDLAERRAADLRELDDLARRRGQSPSHRDTLLSSVILVAGDDPDLNERALRGVLAQTCQPDEIIVVDTALPDSARPPLSAQLANPRIRIVPAPGASVLAARNIGVRNTYGDLIAFLDENQDWYPERIATLAHCFTGSSASKLAWAVADFDEADALGRLTERSVLQQAGALRVRTRLSDCLSDQATIAASNALLSRAALDLVGGFDETLGRYADLDLFIRLLRAGHENAVVDRALSRRPASITDAAETPGSVLNLAEKLIAAVPPDPADRAVKTRRMIASALVGNVLLSARSALRRQDAQRTDACQSALGWFDQWLTRGPDPMLPDRSPLISVIIPLYNGGLYINEAIDSVFSQSLPPDEVIVVDDGSSDNGPAIVAERARTLPIRLIRRTNGGQSAARNTGVENAHGDLLAFLDQDDAWYPTHLEELVKPFIDGDQHSLGWSYSDLDEIDEAGGMVCRGLIRSHHKDAHPKLDLVNCLQGDMFILPSASLIARKAFLKIGGFNERLSGYEDDDLFLRMFRSGLDCVFLEKSLSKWRIYQGSGSYSPRMAASRLIYARILIERFPNEPSRAQHYVRDLIAPRFLRSMSVDFRRCVLNGDYAQQQALLGHLAFIVRHLRARLRLPLQFFVIPALQVPMIARLAAQRRLPMLRLFRSLF